MGMARELAHWTFYLSGFIVIGADLFVLPFNLLEKALTFLIGVILVYMVWLK
jgi:hypothetical protein